MSKPSVEQVKEESRQLRGSIADELAAPEDHFGDDSKHLLKFHGIYQQEDRDTRKERKKAGLTAMYFFMVRSKLPGGKLTPDQYLVHDDLADRYGNGTLRLTSRQGIQMHGVVKGDLKSYIRGLNDALVSTLAACGDVERNVMSCPAPIRSNPVRDDMQRLADRIAEHLCPRTTAYHEIWLNGEKSLTHKNGVDIEPIYGKNYLPRKFKTGIALPEDNCIDLLSNDLGLLAIHDGKSIRGFDVYAGGGMGMTHGNAKTYPRLASPLCFATPDDVIDVATAIVKVQRDHGNREDRKLARLKYTIDRFGLGAFRDKVAEYYGKPLADHTGTAISGIDDHLGWHEQGDGKHWVGVHVLSGRIVDNADSKMRTGLREIVKQFRPTIRISAQQNILLCDVSTADRPRIETLLRQYGIIPADALPLLTRNAMACPAVPTCGLALSDAERVLPDVLQMIQAELTEQGLDTEDITLHMTGCPNGCARPYNSDIGIVGRQPGVYTIFLGGNKLGSQITFQYRDLVKHADLATMLRPVFSNFKAKRSTGESFGDFCQRSRSTLEAAE